MILFHLTFSAFYTLHLQEPIYIIIDQYQCSQRDYGSVISSWYGQQAHQGTVPHYDKEQHIGVKGGGGWEGGTMDIKLCKLTYSYINSILIHLNLFVAIMNDQHHDIRTWTILLKKL